MSTDKTNQSWGGRFSEPVDAFVARFTASVEFDKRLYRHDIMGSIAHATMLAKAGVLTDAERDQIIANLKDIQGEIEAGTFDWRVDLEDVHMNIEARLTALIGDAGKRLHTGRSRNDQVATDVRLWLRGEIDEIGVDGQLRGAQLRERIARDNLANQRNSHELTEQLREAGVGSELDVLRADARLAATEASLPQLQAQQTRARNRIATLLGQRADQLSASRVYTPSTRR